MSYTAWSVVFGEQPSASKWNVLGANDASFADGTGFGNAIVKSKHIDGATLVKGVTGVSQSPVGTSLADVSGSSVTFSVDVNSIILATFGGQFQHNTGTRTSDCWLNVDGANVYNCYQLTNTAIDTHTMVSRTYKGTLTAGSHTIKLQSVAGSSSTVAHNDMYWYALLFSQ